MCVSYRTALIVDDDPIFGALAEDFLLDQGIEQVEAANDGDQGIAKIDAGYAPDILLCDLNMPTHDGVSVIRSLAERRYTGRIIIISGEADPVIETVVKLAKMQGLNILGATRKPLKPDVLKSLLAKAPVAGPKPAAPQQPASPSLLDAAIERGGLHPFFQPKVSMATRQLVGSEALARIATPHIPYANPVPYIELAERNSRIDALTLAMARAVAKHVAAFNAAGAPLPCSINISPASLEKLDFPDLMVDAIRSAGLSCDQFTLEVTETRLVEYGPRALDVMTRMRIKGFGLSVDDFGTGYSNIERLQMYPFTELKVDQSFTKNALTDTFARACVETSVRLAKELGLKVVAEGVETADMWDFLASLGVDEAQGFLMSRPVPPAEFAAMAATGKTFAF
jgi:EAL domain-containing protein (putative c-di-GMP-specific phosphodiesterase class I)/ActR/RegA family two-component response regulator